ncbi:hypothetical protein ACFVWG_09815 [Kribbella sp. NPDC058245]|uniref:hypothetical protein n=1 Tax=Kribbella sp. NPDC058245 TaxID=3346399 RepID=UPI0036EA110B
MSDPTTPSDPAKPTASPESGAETAPPAPAPAVPATTPPKEPASEKPAATENTSAADKAADGDEKPPASADDKGKDAGDQGKDKPGGPAVTIVVDESLPPGTMVVETPGGATAHTVDGEKKVRFWRRGPFVTVAGAVVVLLVLALLGYVWGLGPLNRLNTNRGITPPAKLAGLDRITDPDIRGQLQLDQTKQALSRINNGKQATVEAYGNLDGDRLFVVIALRGKVDIAKTVADSGAAPDKVKKIGQATCVETTGNLPTQCYRGSNTLTVIAQSANEGITVDQVAPVAVEAFHAMK